MQISAQLCLSRVNSVFTSVSIEAGKLIPYLKVSLMHPLRNGIFCNVAGAASSSGLRTEFTSS